MRIGVLILGIVSVDCDPKGSGDSATAATTATTGEASSSGSTSGTTDTVTTTDPGTGVATAESSASTAASTGGPDLCPCNDGECGTPSDLCDTIMAYCNLSCSEGGVLGVEDEVPLQCALAALRDRTPGLISWWADTISDGPGSESAWLHILDDGTVLVDPSVETIFCVSSGPDTHSVLKEPEYFEGSLAAPTPAERFACMIAATAADLAECAPFQDCKP